MAQPFVGEIRPFAGNYPPADWAVCDGSLLQITANETLFTLIGTTYGGDGKTTFGLPDLRGRIPVHNPSLLGESGGVELVALTMDQMPAHKHTLMAASNSASSTSCGNAVLATPAFDACNGGPVDSAISLNTLASVGGSLPHTNMMPYVTITYIISLSGLYPMASV